MSEENNNEPKTPIAAAIDKATGYKPGEENGGMDAAAQDGQQAAAQDGKKDRDWVKEAYECFVKNAVDADPTDPVKAIAAYFEKNATDELKAKAKAEGKTAEGCWKFVEAVARKALGGKSGHIDPVTVYAIAMHYFQDVPKDWNKVEKPSAARPSGVKKPKGGKFKGEPPKKTDLKGGKHKTSEKAEKKKAEAKPKAKKGGKEQGFFFDLLETETAVPAEEGGAAC